MPEIIQKIYDKLTDLYMKFIKKCDEISEKLYEQTGTKINIALIIGIILFVFFVFIFVKAILGIVWQKLSSGDY